MARTTRSSATSRDAATLSGGRGVGGIRPEAPDNRKVPGLLLLRRDMATRYGAEPWPVKVGDCVRLADGSVWIVELMEAAMAKKSGGKKGGGKGKKGC